MSSRKFLSSGAWRSARTTSKCMVCVAGIRPSDCASPFTTASRVCRVMKGCDAAWEPTLTIASTATSAKENALNLRIMNISFIGWHFVEESLLAQARQKPQGESVGKAYIDLRARNSVKHLADRVE